MAYSFWYLLKSNIQTFVPNAVSYTVEDIDNYDNSNYRDVNDFELFSDTDFTINSVAAPTPPSTIVDGEISYVQVDNNKIVEGIYESDVGTTTTIHVSDTDAGPPITVTTTDTTTDTMTPYVATEAVESYKITRFAMLDDMKAHIPPRNEAKKRTIFRWLDADANEIACVWADQLIGTSPSKYEFVN
jgi:hypothetical protein